MDIAMEKEKQEEASCSLWVDWGKRIVSFEKAEGFEECRYSDYGSMLAFAVKMGSEGFGIQ